MSFVEVNPAIKGTKGELVVSKTINSLNRPGYTQLRNILIPSVSTLKMTEIDHVVVSNYGIFCIETKSHNGWIYGSTDNRQWTQVLNPHTKIKFQNPLKQNFGHGKALNEIIGRELLNDRIKSLVAFPFAENLNIDGKNVNVDAVGGTQHVINKMLEHKKIIYTDDDCEKIISRIQTADESNRYTLDQHIEEISSIYARSS